MTLSVYLRVLRRRAWVVVACTLLVPLAALVFSLWQTEIYSSSAEVYINKQNLASAITGIEDSSLLSDPSRVAETQANLAQTPTVARRTLTAAGIDSLTPDELLDDTTVAPKGDSDLLVITVRNPDAALATRLAGEYARQFVAFRAQLDTAAVRKAQNEVQRTLAGLRAQGKQSSSLYRSLEQKDQELATLQTLSTERVSVVRRAGEAKHVAPRPERNVVLGLVLGFVLGVGFALGIDTLDTRMRSATQVGEQLKLPLLARLPAPPKKLAKADQLVMLAQPAGAHAEVFRMLRTNLEFTLLDSTAQTLLVTSAAPEEGKSTTAANLAIALARAGKRVALVDLDLRRPYLGRFFDVPRLPGITDVALGQTSLTKALHRVDLGTGARDRADLNGHGETRGELGTLHVLLSGSSPPNPGEFVGSARLVAILGDLRSHFDTVVVDSPPLLQVGDAMTLSTKVDGVVLVARLNVVRRPMLAEVHRLLDSTPARALGFVITGAGVGRGDGAYGYGYGYGYRYYDEQRAEVERLIESERRTGSVQPLERRA